MLDVGVRTRGGEGLTTCGQRGLGEQVYYLRTSFMDRPDAEFPVILH